MKVIIFHPGASIGGAKAYLINLLPELSSCAPDMQFILYASDSVGDAIADKQLSNVELRTTEFLNKQTWKRILFEQAILPFILRREGVDILFSPVNISTILSRVPRVIALRDVSVFEFEHPKRYSKGHMRLLIRRYLSILSIRTADRIIFISNVTRNQMIDTQHIDKDKTEVIYHGRSPIFVKVSEEYCTELRNRLTAGLKYIFIASNLAEHKNIGNAIRAFKLLDNKYPGEFKLVIAGKHYEDKLFDGMKEICKELSAYDKVLWLGEVDYDEMPSLYSGAELFLFPSLHEAFGQPLVEAMGCGTPIVASDIAVFREIAGEAAVYFDPYSHTDMFQVMSRVIEDHSLRKKLVEEGEKRVKAFDWTDGAEKLARLLRNLE